MDPMHPIGNDVKRHFNIAEVTGQRTAGFVRKRLFQTGSMHFNIYCISPGAENPLHRHPLSDEVLSFVSGRGVCVVGGQTYPVEPGDVVLVPKDTPHGIRNTHPSEHLVCVLAQSPLPCEHVPVKAGDLPTPLP